MDSSSCSLCVAMYHPPVDVSTLPSAWIIFIFVFPSSVSTHHPPTLSPKLQPAWLHLPHLTPPVTYWSLPLSSLYSVSSFSTLSPEGCPETSAIPPPHLHGCCSTCCVPSAGCSMNHPPALSASCFWETVSLLARWRGMVSVQIHFQRL